ncbi:hypothetical protein MKX03_023217 [Papaver bracteatum]|nr:hypothetical protein MKX03_023217 [Papaver bracteatum]
MLKKKKVDEVLYMVDAIYEAISWKKITRGKKLVSATKEGMKLEENEDGKKVVAVSERVVEFPRVLVGYWRIRLDC